MALVKLNYKTVSENDIISYSKQFLLDMLSRRSVRQFSDKSVPLEVIENIIMTAASAPSGANKQPWKFIIIQDADLKRKIRMAAEKEEREFYLHLAKKYNLYVSSGSDYHAVESPHGPGVKGDFLDLGTRS